MYVRKDDAPIDPDIQGDENAHPDIDCVVGGFWVGPSERIKINGVPLSMVTSDVLSNIRVRGKNAHDRVNSSSNGLSFEFNEEGIHYLEMWKYKESEE
mgnify:CR=1 FL=1